MGSMMIHGVSQQIRIATPAKVNLFFELLGKRSDGFHEVETVMSTISLFDFLEVESRIDDEITIEIRHEHGAFTDQPDIPVDERNLIFRALDEVRKFLQQGERVSPSMNLGANVLLEKRIPSAAGLGGASSDAAAAIVAATRIWAVSYTHLTLPTKA